MSGLEVRRATRQDAELLWRWVNDPEVLRHKLRTEAPISWEEHLRWLRYALAEDDVLILIFGIGGEPIGQVRFERTRDEVISIDITVDRRRRGSGWGGKILRRALREAQNRWDEGHLRAEVKTTNRPSQKLFRACGFREVGLTSEGGVKVYERTLDG